jgi:hypothetical protein
MKLLRGDRGCFLSFLASRMRSSRRKSQFEVGWIISPPPSRSRVVLGRASYVACPYIKLSEGSARLDSAQLDPERAYAFDSSVDLSFFHPYRSQQRDKADRQRKQVSHIH